jgi:hypothetical protein
MFKQRFFIALLVGLVFFGVRAAYSCLYFPPSYKSQITENLREFFLFHDEKNVHVVIQTHLKSDGPLPERLAWVVPFPALPIKYEESDPALFEELYNLVGAASFGDGMRSKGGMEMPSNALGSVKVHKTEIVGNYKVHPIEIISDVDVKTTATVLDSWLKKKGFISIPFDLQKPYIKKGATFLAIEMTPKGDEADVKPLHITFPIPSAKKAAPFSIPLRLTHDSRVFDLRIYTFGFEKSWPDNDPFWSKHFGDAFIKMNFPQPDLNWMKANPALSRILDKGHGEIRSYMLSGFNREGGLRARQLPSDPTFKWESTKWKPSIR